MKLYHGSNLIIESPKIVEPKRTLDFGAGFYTTSDLQQGIRWAKVVTKRRANGKPSVSCFELDDKELESLLIKRFNKADGEWLDFVANHRQLKEVDDNFDIIIGPVANDNTMPVINMYINGDYSKDEAIKRLLTQNLTDQYVFKNNKALTKLRFLESKIYE